MPYKRSINSLPLRQRLLDLPELGNTLFLFQRGTSRIVKLEKRSPDLMVGVSVMLAKEPLRPGDPGPGERGVGRRSEVLKLKSFGKVTRVSAAGVCDGQGKLHETGKSVGVDVAQAHDGTTSSRTDDGGEEEIGKATESKPLWCNAGRFARVVSCERGDGGSGGDSGELANSSTSELDATCVRSLLGDLLNKVGIEIDTASSAGVVVQLDRNGTRCLDVEEELLDSGLVDGSSEVSGSDDEDNISSCLRGRLGECNGGSGRVAATIDQLRSNESNSRSGHQDCSV